MLFVFFNQSSINQKLKQLEKGFFVFFQLKKAIPETAENTMVKIYVVQL
ncbi:hypothetical protein SAMN02745219_03499 [Desulfofundulus thermosubterraneus DSM 16057]|uniref:Uncharacterized protein n=1 Tax=Desulfofundulus thermosubterraneus DSM 16057 TaxID=1121432 RepID=A0A1M6MQN9_9FIRM|nr:hypothetical protein SAMN02745219_03499 [Desulfofundulus thermosubterraneus DSM 16057]